MSEHPLSGGKPLSSTNPGAEPTREVRLAPREGASRTDGASASDPDNAARPRRSRRSPRRSQRRKRTDTRAASASAEAEAPPDSGAEAATDGSAEGASRTRRRKSSSRRRSRKTSAVRAEGAAEAPADAPAAAEEGAPAKKRRKRGSRGGRRRRKEGVPAAVEIEAIPGEEDELPELTELPPEAERVEDEGEDAGRGRRGRKSAKKARKTQAKAKKKTRTRTRSTARERKSTVEERSAAPLSEVKQRLILVNAVDPEETRVAVVEDGRIADLQMSVKKHVSYVSDIYRGRVVNLEPAIGAAFVDFGQGRNGFLHASDVLPSYGDPDWSLDKLLSTPVEPTDEWADDDKEAEEVDDEEEKPRQARGRAHKRRSRSSSGRPKRVRLPVEKLLKKGQMVCVQITKDAIGDKGPTLTTYISIPGRYLVLMPSLERTGVSRKIEDERERRRLKRILSSLEIPEGMGVIVRTAGVGRTKTELRRDLEYLLLAWEDFSKRLVSGRNPMPLYQESDVAIRTMRDLFTSETESVIVDDPEVHTRMTEFTTKLMPEHVDRVIPHEGVRPLFHQYGVEQDFEKIFARRVELPSGGSIVIEQTEALVAIDVNSGRTREAGAEFEDIALKTNLEAVPEIARQIRLRDLGGIIVLDYIDMMRSSSRKAVERATREHLRSDRARSKIGRISQFGLLELTRQRLGPGLNKLVYDTCMRCRGSGRRRTASSRAQAILRRLGASLALKGFTTVEVRAHPETVDYLEKELRRELDRLEEKSGRKLVLMPVPDQVEDSVLHYLRADGREVRPGGRRKR